MELSSQEVLLQHLLLFPESQSSNSLLAVQSQPAAVITPTAPVVLPTKLWRHQEVHTSDDPVQECGQCWQDPNTWSRRAHELSEQEMFTCLTNVDP